MIYKRHLLTFGPSMNFAESDHDNLEQEKTMAMGEDEQWEAMPKGMVQPRTWWRKWMKML